MTDAQSLAFENYENHSDSGFRPVPRGTTVQSPRLRGWRIDRSNPPRLKAMLRRRARPAMGVSWEFEEYGSPRGRDDQEQRRKEFDQHAETFKAETRFLSSIHQIVLHPSYLRIIGMGPAALPFIFEELRKRPTHWFPALYAICGFDPVPEEDRGQASKMAQHWIRWGKKVGLLK